MVIMILLILNSCSTGPQKLATGNQFEGWACNQANPAAVCNPGEKPEFFYYTYTTAPEQLNVSSDEKILECITSSEKQLKEDPVKLLSKVFEKSSGVADGILIASKFLKKYGVFVKQHNLVGCRLESHDRDLCECYGFLHYSEGKRHFEGVITKIEKE